MIDNNYDFTLIKAGLLVDGNGGNNLHKASVLIQNGVIKFVGNQESVVAPEGASVKVLDYGDKTILPGLIDCHVHLNGIGDGRVGNDLVTLPDEVLTLQSAKNARKHLYSGVTTVRDCGAKNNTTFMLRKAIEMGITISPRLILTGRPISIVGGHLGYFGEEATGEVECVKSVRKLIKQGADFIKITATGGSTITSLPFRPSFTKKEIQAITFEAHKMGKHVAAHCSSSEGIINSLDSGVDTIIHGYHVESDETFNYRPEITEKFIKNGAFLNPTLFQGRKTVEVLELKQNQGYLTRIESEILETAKYRNEKISEIVSKMVSDGVQLACGSDASWTYYKTGDFQSEIFAHVSVGLSPMQAIVSATKDSARSCWIDDKLGTLSENKIADILVVDGDPTEDINNLRNVVDVISNGEVVDRENFI